MFARPSQSVLSRRLTVVVTVIGLLMGGFGSPALAADTCGCALGDDAAHANAHATDASDTCGGSDCEDGCPDDHAGPVVPAPPGDCGTDCTVACCGLTAALADARASNASEIGLPLPPLADHLPPPDSLSGSLFQPPRA